MDFILFRYNVLDAPNRVTCEVEGLTYSQAHLHCCQATISDIPEVFTSRILGVADHGFL
jgi:hypothetical protein